MNVIIINNTAVKGQSIQADPDKIITLADADARALISAGKAVQTDKKPAEKKPAEKKPAKKAD